ncbi:hypothetical protein DXG03_005529 [Asterophora parasitica]|uniref:HMG box domain-containing protein n=1 Tax=Asterophora parasitica TaxID=117018 RepID=A0A9P7KFA5_9AGAR|nr:hypothetical protein DXG03_005529 [Asterophora parasitica]
MKKKKPAPRPESKKGAAKPSKAKKPKAKPKVPKPTRIPTLPHYGPTPFIHFIKSYFNVDKPAVTSETLIERAQAAGVAWKELPEHEKEKIKAESRVLRDEAKIKRDAFICDLDPAVLKELNRRRVARNKPRVVAHYPDHVKRPNNAYILKTHGHTLEGLPLTQQAQKIGGIWREMSEAEKEPWVERYKEAKAEWARNHKTEASHAT